MITMHIAVTLIGRPRALSPARFSTDGSTYNIFSGLEHVVHAFHLQLLLTTHAVLSVRAAWILLKNDPSTSSEATDSVSLSTLVDIPTGDRQRRWENIPTVNSTNEWRLENA